MHSLSRTAVALALVPWLVLSASVAPEHIHEADEHHSEAVVHRHLEPHHHDGLEFYHDHDGAEFSQSEERVIWLDDVGVQPSTYAFVTDHAVVAPHFGTLPEPEGWVIPSTLDGAPPHGPPRPYTSLRAPPSLSQRSPARYFFVF